ncbi:MAG: hypothetical protein ACJATN_002934 [Neolewinella sp.]|jgi:hypothetical protein
MTTSLTKLSLLLSFCFVINACTPEAAALPSERITITYELERIDSIQGTTGTIDFCGRGQSLQRVQGSQLGDSYTATFGIRLERDSLISSAGVFVVGNDELPDTLISSTTSVLRNVELILAGSQDHDAYVELFIDYEEKRYSSVFFDNLNRVGVIPDVNADQAIEFSLDDELRCGLSQRSIVETKLNYDGHVYNIRDRSDSIKVEGFKATIFNNSF